MKIVARVNWENAILVESLKARGINAKLVRKGVIIELPVAPENKYEIPVDVFAAVLLIDCEESGGGMTNTGSGTIICGLSGKTLRPYYVPKGYCNSIHAHFAVPEAVVTITGYRKDSNIKIEEYRIVREDHVAYIKTREIWSGELEALPDTFSNFRAAAEAASQKGNCYHCRCVHYADR